ncbi:MAG: hypothetical protein KME25_28595 [Symplocastrum torsivum CPER-KK1]|jgi:hypothetical protein|uniref:Uncharacterized protein n=1 Tax=Symplocastrum torsivum CPER-KK1 TaxID=450513 RepID=A0A951PQG7_9CYAN|nr:hypothetical protein [Symplocastrum torsivum CPER-KK1]
MKCYQFFLYAWNVPICQGKFCSEAQVKKAAQQLTSSVKYQVEYKEVFQLSPHLPIFSSNILKPLDFPLLVLVAGLLGLLLGTMLLPVFLPNQANQVMERLFPSQVLSK